MLLGYSAAALHLRDQLAAAGVAVDADHPLFVYLPCGVGGAPAGIAFGLRQLFGAHVHCFFAEPVRSPCFWCRCWPAKAIPRSTTMARTTAPRPTVCRAARLATGRPVMTPLLSGVFTVTDATLFRHLAQLDASEGLHIEPSAAAGFSGPDMLCRSAVGAYLEHHTAGALPRATHGRTTGGLFVPPEEYRGFLAKAARLAAA